MEESGRTGSFWVKSNNENIINNVHESDNLIKIPLIILAVLSFSFIFNLNPFNPEGWVFESISTYEGNHYHQESIQLYHNIHHEMKNNHSIVSILSVFMGTLGVLFGVSDAHPLHRLGLDGVNE